MAKNKLNELGQAMVEFAVTLPIFLLVFFAVMDLSWIGYQHIVFDYSYQVAVWEMSGLESSESNSPIDISESFSKKYITDGIKSNAVGINISNIYVNNASIKLRTVIEKVKEINGTLRDEYRRYALISGVIEYKFKPLTYVGELIFGSDISITKTLNRIRLLRMKR